MWFKTMAYDASDYLKEFFAAENVFDMLESSIELIDEQLKNEGLSIESISGIKYKDLAKMDIPTSLEYRIVDEYVYDVGDSYIGNFSDGNNSGQYGMGDIVEFDEVFYGTGTVQIQEWGTINSGSSRYLYIKVEVTNTGSSNIVHVPIDVYADNAMVSETLAQTDAMNVLTTANLAPGRIANGYVTYVVNPDAVSSLEVDVLGKVIVLK